MAIRHNARRPVVRAGVDVKLIVGLVAVLLLAGGIWGYRAYQNSAEKNLLMQDEYYLKCSECKKIHTIPKAEASLEVQDGKWKCPVCGKFAGHWVSADEAAKPYKKDPKPPKGVKMP